MKNMDKVLVIDDKEDIRSVLKDMLNMSGYEVDTAADGKSAKELYDKNEYAAVITDIISKPPNYKDLIAKVDEIVQSHKQA